MIEMARRVYGAEAGLQQQAEDREPSAEAPEMAGHGHAPNLGSGVRSHKRLSVAAPVGIVAALRPAGCKAMVSVSGYLIGSRELNKALLPPAAEQQWWYQYYFATGRGRARLREEPARLRQADLVHRFAEMGIRPRHLRAQRGDVRQPRSCRDLDP